MPMNWFDNAELIFKYLSQKSENTCGVFKFAAVSVANHGFSKHKK